MGPHGQQRLSALREANDMRLARVQLFRRIDAGEVFGSDLIVEQPEMVEGMFLFDFLRELPGIGLRTIRELNKLGVREHFNLAVVLEELTPTRREWLRDWLAAKEQRSARQRPTLARRPQG